MHENLNAISNPNDTLSDGTAFTATRTEGKSQEATILTAQPWEPVSSNYVAGSSPR